MKRSQIYGALLLVIIGVGLISIIAPEDHVEGRYRIEASVNIGDDKVTVPLVTILGKSNGIITKNITSKIINGLNYTLEIMGLDKYARSPGNSFWAHVRLLMSSKVISLAKDQIRAVLRGPNGEIEEMKVIEEGSILRLEKSIRVNTEIALYVFVAIIVIWALFALKPLIAALSIPVLAILFVNIPAVDVLSVFWDPAIALIFGALIIAYSMEKTGLAKRISYIVVCKARSPRKLMIFLSLVAFLLSMWMSSIATIIVMLPIISTILKTFNASEKSEYAQGITLSVIFGSVLGGISTIVGNPANALAISVAHRALGIKIDFIEWIMFSLPISLMFLIIITPILAKVFDIRKDIEHGYILFDEARLLMFKAHLMGMGPLTRQEKITMVVLIGAITGWIISSMLTLLGIVYYLHFVAIALAAAGVLILTGTFDEKDLGKIRWDIILTLGGSVSFSVLMSEAGLLDIFSTEIGKIGILGALILLISMIIILSLILGSLVSIAICIPLLLSIGVTSSLPIILLALLSSIIILGPNGIVLEEHIHERGFLKYRNYLKFSIIFTIITATILIALTFFAVIYPKI